MNMSRTKTYKKKRQQKRVFSILTLVFLLVQTILTPVAQYVNAEGPSVNLSFSQTEAQEGDTLTATLTDTGEDSGTLTFTGNDGLSIEGIAGGQENVDIATQQDQTMSFTWKEGSSKTLTVNVAANEAGSGTAILTSENGGTSSAAVQITAQEEVVSEEAVGEEVVASEEQTEQVTVTSEEDTNDGSAEEQQNQQPPVDEQSNEKTVEEVVENQEGNKIKKVGMLTQLRC